MTVQTKEELLKQLSVDVEDIANRLIRAFRLKHERKSDSHPSLLRWLDFRLRWVDPIPRRVYLSNRFPKSLNEPNENALHALISAIQVGRDINPFQGKGLIRMDSSSKRRAERTDLLWADWGIHHLHLTEKMGTGSYFCERSDYLLFIVFGPEFALFVDVLPHKGELRFSRQELIRVVAQNWPEVLAPFELPGRSMEQMPTDEDRHKLRRAGIEAPLFLEGKVYIAPGYGVTSASTSGRVTDYAFRLRRNLNVIAHHILDPHGQVLAMMPESRRSASQFCLRLHSLGLAIHEVTTELAWTFPNATINGPHSAYDELTEALAPPWVQKALSG